VEEWLGDAARQPRLSKGEGGQKSVGFPLGRPLRAIRLPLLLFIPQEAANEEDQANDAEGHPAKLGQDDQGRAPCPASLRGGDEHHLGQYASTGKDRAGEKDNSPGQ
jgi:hypothetical protein